MIPFVFWGTWGTFRSREHIFVAVGADYSSWLQNYKITQWMRGRCKVLNIGGWVGRLPKSIKCEQGRERGGRSKFWSFCVNIIIECPHGKCSQKRKLKNVEFSF